MKIERKWAMASAETFKIKPIRELIERYIDKEKIWIDPFSRNSIFANHCTFTNDLNPEIKATHNLEATDFLKIFGDETIDGVLFDPPYSFRQIQECYQGIGRKVFQSDTNGSFFSSKKNEIARIVKSGGICISFGWNSSGMGLKRGFKIVEILLVPHGATKNDTIVTVEIKE